MIASVQENYFFLNPQEIKNTRFLISTKQCAHFQHALPLNKATNINKQILNT